MAASRDEISIHLTYNVTGWADSYEYMMLDHVTRLALGQCRYAHWLVCMARISLRWPLAERRIQAKDLRRLEHFTHVIYTLMPLTLCGTGSTRRPLLDYLLPLTNTCFTIIASHQLIYPHFQPSTQTTLIHNVPDPRTTPCLEHQSSKSGGAKSSHTVLGRHHPRPN